MTVDELATLVRLMRDAQTAYFRNRSPQHLNRAKGLERDVDKAVAEVLNKQRGLFDGVENGQA